jgi:hypothetical protein
LLINGQSSKDVLRRKAGLNSSFTETMRHPEQLASVSELTRSLNVRSRLALRRPRSHPFNTVAWSLNEPCPAPLLASFARRDCCLRPVSRRDFVDRLNLDRGSLTLCVGMQFCGGQGGGGRIWKIMNIQLLERQALAAAAEHPYLVGPADEIDGNYPV